MFTSSTERGDCSFSWIIINRSGEPDVWPNHHILQKPGFPWNRGIYRNPSYLLRCLQTRVFGRELISPDWFTVSIHYSSNLFWGTEDRNLRKTDLKTSTVFFSAKVASHMLHGTGIFTYISYLIYGASGYLFVIISSHLDDVFVF